MQVWKLSAHHEDPELAIQQMKEHGRIAIGWSNIGDLSDINPHDAQKITSLVKNIYPNLSNAHLGGPSLWRFFSQVEVGDQVIMTTKGKRYCVFEVIGPYIFDPSNAILNYSHQRCAVLTDINPDKLWGASNSSVAKGENNMWTFARCQESDKSSKLVHTEGKRFSITSTAIERDSYARKKCIEHFGYTCQVCGMDFEKVYGKIGEKFIHVHHRVDLAHRDGEHTIDPIKDLIPLCPNCHSMIHTEKPAMSLETLRNICNKS